ncbi:unnamed protein product [Pleuronectes platessa]|uniref:Uncharacterized protein n=1 Tax=Pleuronectes platessa TaxID=8262 RepID=A0A9N7Z5K7_PLEPL|nr:unnamed protein product [Pleuronectes platessa]
MFPRTTELWQTHRMEVFPLCDPGHYHMRIEAEGRMESSLKLPAYHGTVVTLSADSCCVCGTPASERRSGLKGFCEMMPVKRVLELCHPWTRRSESGVEQGDQLVVRMRGAVALTNLTSGHSGPPQASSILPELVIAPLPGAPERQLVKHLRASRGSAVRSIWEGVQYSRQAELKADPSLSMCVCLPPQALIKLLCEGVRFLEAVAGKHVNPEQCRHMEMRGGNEGWAVHKVEAFQRTPSLLNRLFRAGDRLPA